VSYTEFIDWLKSDGTNRSSGMNANCEHVNYRIEMRDYDSGQHPNFYCLDCGRELRIEKMVAVDES